MAMTGSRLIFSAALIAALGLFGCASPTGPGPSVSGVLPLVINPAASVGTIVAIRPMIIEATGGSQGGVNAVLAALQQPQAAGSVALEELVINRADNAPTSVIVGGSGFAVGDRVTVIAGAETEVVRRD
jgi:outer membrane lipoprotein SlyB